MRKNTDASAKYKKLDNGDWAVWINDLPESMLVKGKTISVTTQSGNVRTEKLLRQKWVSDDGKLQLWEIYQKDTCHNCDGLGATARQIEVNEKYGHDYVCPACNGSGKARNEGVDRVIDLVKEDSNW